MTKKATGAKGISGSMVKHVSGGLKPLSEADARWVQSTLDSLDERRMIGQLLMPVLSKDAAAPLGIAEMVKKTGVGGGWVGGGKLEEVAAMIDSVRGASAIPPLISGDLENGAGLAIPECTTFPTQMGLGAAGDESLARIMGDAIAAEGMAVGFNWVFGPVVDVCRISTSTRMLGSDPHKVARLGVSIIRSVQSRGMAACAKHFPGGGQDEHERDSHLTTPINTLSAAQWWKISAVPFQAAIDEGVFSIMTSHFGLPSLDSDCGDPRLPRPATISGKLLIDVLRQKMGFEGLVITDALCMAGVTLHLRRLEMLPAALNAGQDMLLFVRRLPDVVDYLMLCLKEGRLSRQRLEQAARRVLEMKARLGLHRTEPIRGLEKRRQELAKYDYSSQAWKCARRAVTLLRDEKGVFPLKLKSGARIASVLITNVADFRLDGFEEQLRCGGMRVESFVNPSTEKLYDRIEAGEFDLVITSLYYPYQYGWGTSVCHGPQSRCLMSGFFFANPKVPAVFISFAHPFHLTNMAFMDPFICTWGGAAGVQKAAAEALLGEISFAGRAPVRLDKFFEVGDGLDGTVAAGKKAGK